MMRKKTPISNRGTKTTHVIEALKEKESFMSIKNIQMYLVENKHFYSEPQKFQLLEKSKDH